MRLIEPGTVDKVRGILKVPSSAWRCGCGCEEMKTVAALAADRTYRGVCAACRNLWPTELEELEGRTPLRVDAFLPKEADVPCRHRRSSAVCSVDHGAGVRACDVCIDCGAYYRPTRPGKRRASPPRHCGGRRCTVGDVGCFCDCAACVGAR
jgi:hypothetical protein